MTGGAVAGPPVAAPRQAARAAFTRLVLERFEAAPRDLPWRRTRDPWAVLVAEVMLQQTQAERAAPRWQRFMARFPTPVATAAAAAADVIEEWQGLGYNRRALWLHRAAVAVAERHGGRVPEDLDDLLALPGVGPYTARAVRVFAFERDDAVLDTNVGRVLARAVAGRPLARDEAQALADDLVPAGDGWRWNQAMLDLGATTCTARAPRCGTCPVALVCAWRTDGVGEADPATDSAATSRPQSPFEGSDRQGRGRLVRACTHGPVALDDVPTAMGWPDDATRARRVASRLVADGMLERRGDDLVLTGSDVQRGGVERGGVRSGGVEHGHGGQAVAGQVVDEQARGGPEPDEQGSGRG